MNRAASMTTTTTIQLLLLALLCKQTNIVVLHYVNFYHMWDH